MVVKRKFSTDTSVHQTAEPRHPGWRRPFSRWFYKWYVRRNRTPISDTQFSLQPADLDLSTYPSVRQADLINLHWVADFQSSAALRRLQQLGDRKSVV